MCDLTRHCPICREQKPVGDFYLRRGDKPSGYCKPCAAAKSNRYFYENRDAALAKCREGRKILRSEMLSAYGCQCELCGETVPEFLTLDHKEGGGKKHQQDLGGNRGIMRQLKKLGWPKDLYRLLCWNCNCSRDFQWPEIIPKPPLSATKRCPACLVTKLRETDFCRAGKFSAPYCKTCEPAIHATARRGLADGSRLPNVPCGIGILAFCKKCGLFKEAAAHFHANNTESSGRQAYCKQCTRKLHLRRKEKDNAAARLRCAKYRLEAQAALGGKCECCGITNHKFLTIDHVHGGGMLERRTPGTKGSLYCRARKEGFPRSKYRLLCYNCNCATSAYGFCHKNMT